MFCICVVLPQNWHSSPCHGRKVLDLVSTDQWFATADELDKRCKGVFMVTSRLICTKSSINPCFIQLEVSVSGCLLSDHALVIGAEWGVVLTVEFRMLYFVPL